MRRSLLLGLGLLLSGCGGSSNDSDHADHTPAAGQASAGGSGSGGAASGGTATTGGQTGSGGSVSVSGGSGGTSAQGLVRAAFSYKILAPDSSCSLAEQFLDVPKVDGGHPVTATEVFETLENGGSYGGNELKVWCQWYGPNQIELGISGGRAWSIVVSAYPQDKEAHARANTIAPLQAPYRVTPRGPLVQFDASDDYRAVQGTLTAPVFTDDNADVCALGESYFYAENCIPPKQ